MVERKDPDVRRAIISLLCEGMITIPEAARLAGVSRQLVRHWARNVRWAQIREHRLATWLRKEMRRGKLTERTKNPKAADVAHDPLSGVPASGARRHQA